MENPEIKAMPQRFDVVHPDLKNILDFHHQSNWDCDMCGSARGIRNFISAQNVAFCSWDCAIEYNDYLNWQYEMERKGEKVNKAVWTRTNRGTTFYETEGKAYDYQGT